MMATRAMRVTGAAAIVIGAGSCQLIFHVGDPTLEMGTGGGGGGTTSSSSASSSGGGATSTSSSTGGSLMCTDGKKDGDETDVDCGGSCTVKCATGKACGTSDDCMSVSCFGGTCISCTDGKKDGDETDVDCGGSCATKCADGSACGKSTDCTSVNCFGGTCISCADSEKDGDETDIDCGGSCSAKCAFNQMCTKDSDCATTFCNLGVCGAFTIATVSGRGTLLAVDPLQCLFSTQDDGAGTYAIQKVPLGGGLPIALASGPNSTGGLTSDADNVYFATETAIMSAPLSVGPAVQLAVGNSPGGIAINLATQKIYWTNLADGSVQKVSIAGGMPTQVASGSTGGAAKSIAVDPISVYWTDTGQGKVFKVALAGGAATMLATSPGPYALAVNTTGAFWVDGAGGGHLFSVSLGGGTPTKLATWNNFNDLAIDSTFAYLASGNNSGSIMKVPLVGGSLVTLVSGLSKAAKIAVDAQFIYWIENTATTCTVKKIHK